MPAFQDTILIRFRQDSPTDLHEVCEIAKLPSFPRKAGIETRDFNPAFLDSRLRESDEKNQIAHLV